MTTRSASTRVSPLASTRRQNVPCCTSRSTRAWYFTVMSGWFSHAWTSRRGRTHAARACQSAGASKGKLLRCSRFALAGQDSFGPSSLQPLGTRVSPSLRLSSTPVARQSMPDGSRRSSSIHVLRMPARVRRDSRASSADTCGASSPTGKPDAPAAGPSAASSTVTRQPRRARLAATAAPASPAPMTAQCPGASTRTGKGSRRRTVHVGANTPARQSRLGGRPIRLPTVNPHCISASRTARAIVQVAMPVPCRANRATCLSVSTDHMSGLRRGLNPSRKILSASKRCARSID